jgi:hypothetical protein
MFRHVFYLPYMLFLRVFPQFAVHQTSSGGPDDNYYGLHTTMGVYNHKLKPGQWSVAAIWVYNKGDGVNSSFNSIEAGWHVSVNFLVLSTHSLLVQTLIE